jgi:hypothetical protein
MQLKKEIKQDARDWITYLTKERSEYISLYKQGIDTFKVCQQELWKLLGKEDTKAIEKIQCILGIGKLEREIMQLYDAMPIVKALTDDNVGISNNNEQMIH